MGSRSGIATIFKHCFQDAAGSCACASNLRQIVAAIQTYGNEQGEFPRTTYNDAVGGVPYGEQLMKAFTASEGDDPFGGTRPPAPTFSANGNSNSPANNDVTAALFLLVRTQKIPTSLFICPSSDDEPDDLKTELPTKRSNFQKRSNLSYSVTLPYPLVYVDSGGTKSQLGYYYGLDMSKNLPIVADLNPGTSGTPKVYELVVNSPSSDMRGGNSRNHGRKGQNVAFFDGRVEFFDTPFAGVDRDNIYTRTTTNPAPADRASDTSAPPDSAFGSLPPRHVSDSVMLPTETSMGSSAFLP